MWEFAGAIGSTLVLVVVGIIRNQLAKRDETQEKMIQDLYAKHELDARLLQDLTVKIAENHYPKPEVDRMLDRFKSYLDERFSRLETILAQAGHDRRTHD